MTEKELTELSDQELLAQRKKAKSNLILNATILGLFIGIAIYSTIKNGFGFFTFFPLFFAYFLFKNQADGKALEKEIKSRNLNPLN